MSDTQMDLSEAIRLGAMLKPQGFGSLHTKRRTGFLGLFGPSVDATCALGAAFEAAGCTTVPSSPGDQPFRGTRRTGAPSRSIQIPLEWRPVLNHYSSCPECGVSDPIIRLIPHLNDKHQWTRGSIADFVQTIEAQFVQSFRTIAKILRVTSQPCEEIKQHALAEKQVPIRQCIPK